jgi:hypothetical protein
MNTSDRNFFRAAQLALALICAHAALLPGPAVAYDRRPGESDSPYLIKTRIRHFYSSGYAKIRDAAQTPAGGLSNSNARVYMGKTLVFTDIDTPLNLISAEIQPLSGVSAELEYGNNDLSGGTFSETSWLDAPDNTIVMNNGAVWANPEHREYAEDRAELSGTTRLYALNLYYRIYKSPLKSISHDLDLAHHIELAAGYSWYRDSLSVFYGEHALSTNVFVPTPPRGTFRGLASACEMSWEGWRGGFREQARISQYFSMEGKFFFGPTMEYRGEGWWNLRTDLANPSYRETAKGQLVEFSAAISWKTRYNFQVDGGYIGWMYHAVSGTRRLFYPGGSSSTEKLDEIKTTRKGWFLGLTWRY